MEAELARDAENSRRLREQEHQNEGQGPREGTSSNIATNSAQSNNGQNHVEGAELQENPPIERQISNTDLGILSSYPEFPLLALQASYRRNSTNPVSAGTLGPATSNYQAMSTYLPLISEAVKDIAAIFREEVLDSEAISELIRLAEQDYRWVDIVIALASIVPASNVMSGSLFSLLMNLFALPPRTACFRLNERVIELVREPARHDGPETPLEAQQDCSSAPGLGETTTVPKKESSSSTALSTDELTLRTPSHIKVNTCILWSLLAQSQAGTVSKEIMNDEVQEILAGYLKDGDHPNIQLGALIAMEAFSITGDNKKRLVESPYFLPLLHALEAKNQSYWNREAASPVEEAYRLQVQHMSQWCLDNVFPCEERNYDLTQDIEGVRYAFSKLDCTPLMKISRNGLMVRSDHPSFESIRGFSPCRKGSWFYEVTLQSAGIFQIGWATRYARFGSEDGSGVGDDDQSFAYDGCRNRFWHKGEKKATRERHWIEGDVVGCLLNWDVRTFYFFLNGRLTALHTMENGTRERLTSPRRSTNSRNGGDGLYPALSLTGYQQCEANFGGKPFRYPPPCDFCTFHDAFDMPSAEKSWQPKLAILKAQRQELMDAMKRTHRRCPRASTKTDRGKRAPANTDSPSACDAMETEPDGSVPRMHTSSSTLDSRASGSDEGAGMCSICFDEVADTILLPCHHGGYCRDCALRIDKCAICRGSIKDRVPASTADFDDEIPAWIRGKKIVFVHDEEGDQRVPAESRSTAIPEDQSVARAARIEEKNPVMPLIDTSNTKATFQSKDHRSPTGHQLP